GRSAGAVASVLQYSRARPAFDWLAAILRAGAAGTVAGLAEHGTPDARGARFCTRSGERTESPRISCAHPRGAWRLRNVRAAAAARLPRKRAGRRAPGLARPRRATLPRRPGAGPGLP